MPVCLVTKASNVNTVAAKGGRVNAMSSGPDLDSMNPALKRNPNGSGNVNMQPPKVFGRDRALGQTVTVKKGGYKGLLGIIKDTTDTHARVELHTKSKIITVPKADLTFKDKITGRAIDVNSRGGMSGRGGFGSNGSRGEFGGSANPEWQGGSRTPMVSSSSARTPAWGASKGMSHEMLAITSFPHTDHRHSFVTHSGLESPVGSVWLADPGLGRWFADCQPVRWQSHCIWLRLAHPGLVGRSQDSCPRWFQLGLKDPCLWRPRRLGLQDPGV